MVAFHESHVRDRSNSHWQQSFLQLLPQIERHLRFAFRGLRSEEREEAVQEGIATCLQALVRLYQRGCEHKALASSLARFAARHVICGRQVACRLNVHDPLSRHAQRTKGIKVERLDRFDRDTAAWVNALVDTRHAPIPDQVALRIDVPSWLKTLSRQRRKIAKDLAIGSSTGEVARKYRLSSGRISQIRQELRDSWNHFQKSADPEASGV